ncbi:FAD-dependent monooxygenase [Mycobacterium sp. 050134]|uniref:FAD-dependent monooxygenase n=1 Tax=Mycobacterium sp. 050134 TaxID=3096111 RepID=UPI002EDB2CA0
MPTRETPVVIAGGGAVGLVASILLSQAGIEHLLLETRLHASTHPKARGISARSMEILRRIGVEDQVRAAGLPADHVAMYRGASLIDPAFVRTTVDADPRRVITPSPGVICSQDVLEALLADKARQEGGDQIRFGQTLFSFDQHRDGVRSLVKDAANQQIWEVESRYLVGCDGARSTIRQNCNVPMDGQNGLGHFTSVRFNAPLAQVVADRVSASYFLTPPARGGFMAIDNDSHWIYQYPFDPTVEDPASFDEHQWIALIRAAVGIDDLEVAVLDIMDWRMDACLATTYRADQVLLAGDAAHLTPPTGGHGMNLGIGDADNLAWKLAAVLSGQAKTALLDTYQTERRPIAAQIINIATDNARARGGYRFDDELLLSATYVSTAVITADTGAGSHLNPDGYTPGAHPGQRLPHIWLPGSAQAQSTLDLIGIGFVLLHGPTAAQHWQHETSQAARHGLPINDHPLPAQQQWHAFARLCALTETGALLVRPDGHIAWRTDVTPEQGTLTPLLNALLGN